MTRKQRAMLGLLLFGIMFSLGWFVPKGWAWALFLSLINAPAWALIVRLIGSPVPWLPYWMFLAVMGIAISFWTGPEEWATLTGSSVSLLIAILIWLWRRTKDRRRALAAWGAKALARLREMISVLRERAKPRPVLRPGRVPA